MRESITPTGRELTFGEDELIVTKTDPRGIITYTNEVFTRLSGYSESELIGSAHNVIRHPQMPRAIFKLLWSTLQSGNEIFAYVVNLSRNGDSYWVFAHVTPSFNAAHQIVGYHSNRRVPHPDALVKVKALYARILETERSHSNPREAAEAGLALLNRILAEQTTDYASFVFSLSSHTNLAACAA